ncbi:hypothetical protein WJX74_000256 [Apatococcus lobatus]|uniref:Uncharacterized protein n=1 Tax=Apatococcus lobatus TaxID=904363 RepID=A0AAW1RJG5_9CHLO
MSSPHVRQSPRLKEQRQQQQQQPDYFPAVTHEADVLSPPPSHQHAAFGQHAAEGLAGGASSSGGSPARPGSNISSLAVQAVHRQQALEWAQWGVKVMLLMWTTAIGWGYLNHADSDEKPNKELTLPLLWFDRQVLRRFGAFLPLLVLALRCWSSIEAVTIHGRRIPFPTWACLYIYITLSRLGVYVIHAAGSLQWVNNFFPAEVATSDHMMSDHVFLTASIATILMCEAIFILLRIRFQAHVGFADRGFTDQLPRSRQAGSSMSLQLCVLFCMCLLSATPITVPDTSIGGPTTTLRLSLVY